MKKLIYIALPALLAMAGACSRYADRTVDNPQYESCNTTQAVIKFTRAQTTDSTTVLEGYVKFRPHWWIRFDEKMCVVADGVKYKLLHADSINPGDTIWMPENGKCNFRFTFEPVPASADKIDFMEDCDDGWMVWGIDLTGKADYRSTPEGLPKELRSDLALEALPQPRFDSDSTTVNIHLLGFRPGMNRTWSYGLNTIKGQTTEMESIKLDENGNASVKVKLYGPTEFFVFDSNNSLSSATMMLSPGETADIYTDLRRIGQYLNKADDEKFEPYVWTWSTGYYAPQDQAMRKYHFTPLFQPYSSDFIPADVDNEGMAELLISTLKQSRDSIATLDIPETAKEVLNLATEAEYLACVAGADDLAERAYKLSTGDWRAPVPEGAVKVKLTPEFAARMAKEVRDVNDPRLLSTAKYGSTGISDLVSPVWKEALGTDALLSELSTTVELMKKVDKGNFGDADRAAADSLTREDFRNMIEARMDDAKIENSRIDYSLISETPAVANDKLFDEIIAPHKGKVVMVDLWNTWCGPCRGALKANEPEKSGDLSSDDIVWIYIADESSPIADYGRMIKDIKGIHYRVSEDQIGAIRKRFNVDGIPYYILVDREGNATGRPDLRDHKLFKKTLLDEVAK